MGRQVILDADGNCLEDDGLVCGADAETWHRLYEELYNAKSVIDEHALARLRDGFKKLKLDSCLPPVEYEELRGFDEADRPYDVLRVDMLNDIIDRYEDMLDAYLSQTLEGHGRKEYGVDEHDKALKEYKWAASVAADIVTQFADCEIPKICNELGERYDLAYEHCFMRLAAAITQEVADILIENGKV